MNPTIAFPFLHANCLFIFLQNFTFAFQSRIEFWNSDPAEAIKALGDVLDNSNQKHLHDVCFGDYSKWNDIPQFANIPVELAITIGALFSQALNDAVTANFHWRDTAIEYTANLNNLIID